MKTLSLAGTILIHLLSAITFISCTEKEPNEPATDNTKETDTLQMLSCFVATIENYQTKAQVFIETGKAKFLNGDCVVVSNGTQTADFTYDLTKQLFSTDTPIQITDNLTAFYPKKYFDSLTDGAINITLPQEQAYIAGKVEDAPMAGSWNGKLFTFKNLCSIIRFDIPANEAVKKIEFTSNNAILSGPATIHSNTLTMTGPGTKTISVSIPEGFTPDKNKPICVVVPSQTYTGGFSAWAETMSGIRWESSLESDKTLNPGCISIIDALKPSYFSGGSGTMADPYLISSVSDLIRLSEYIASAETEKEIFRSAHYRQTGNIDFQGETFHSIGRSTTYPFKGIYDGGGYKISDIVITNPASGCATGMFGYLDSGAKVLGIKMDNASINASANDNGFIAGCIQPSSGAIIKNCEVSKSSLTSSNAQNGGICGKVASGEIEGCRFNGSIVVTAGAKHNTGGIAGQISNAGIAIKNCHTDASIKTNGGNTAGIVGDMNIGASITGCTVSETSTIEGGSKSNNGIHIGGIAGRVMSGSGGKIQDCTCCATITAHYLDVGGIIGNNYGILTSRCSFSGKIISDYADTDAANEKFSRVGGICGRIIEPARVDDCTMTGEIDASAYVGGIVGWMERGSITSCKINGAKIKGTANVGGVAGRFKSGIIKGCNISSMTLSAVSNAGGAVGSVVEDTSLSLCTISQSTVTASDSYAGGMIGLYSTGGYIAQCSSSNTIVSAGDLFAGGMLGGMENISEPQQGKIEKCNVTGGKVSTVNGRCGGILGGTNQPEGSKVCGIINQCSASCHIHNNGTGQSGNVGGIAGYIVSENFIIANTVYHGGEIVNSGTNGGVGGICGFLYSETHKNSGILNCCAFPTKLQTGSGTINMGGICGTQIGGTIQNCYCPAAKSSYIANGGTPDTHCGSLYGWMKGLSASESCSATVIDCYWLDGFKAGEYQSGLTYNLKEQSLSEAQMKNTGAVSCPSAGTSFGSFLQALNAGADNYNSSSLLLDIRADEWIMGSNGYPVVYGCAIASSTTGSTKKRVSLLGDSITTFRGYTLYPGIHQYPNANYKDFTSVTLTYWYKIIYEKMSDAVLEANSSFGGTCVADTHDAARHPGYGFLQRYVDLGNPDIIILNGGTNDACYTLPLGKLDFTLETDDLDTYQFAQAYDKLIRLLKEKYPKAKVVAIISDRVRKYSSADDKSAYEKIMEEVCLHHNIPCAKVVLANRSSLTYDWTHPNVAGMTEMADQIWNQLKSHLQ